MLNTFKLSLSIPWQLLRAAGQILKNPRLFGLAAVPGAIGSATFVLGIVLAIYYRSNITALLGLTADSWWFALTAWLVVLLSIFLSALLGFVSANLIGMFSIDALVDDFLLHYGVTTASQRRKGLTNFLKSILGEICFLILIASITIFTFIISFIPILALLSAGLTVFLIGASFFSTALALLNLSFSERVSILKKLVLPCLTIGTIFTGLLFIPFVGIVLMPVFSGAAAIILSEVKGHNSEL